MAADPGPDTGQLLETKSSDQVSADDVAVVSSEIECPGNHASGILQRSTEAEATVAGQHHSFSKAQSNSATLPEQSSVYYDHLQQHQRETDILLKKDVVANEEPMELGEECKSDANQHFIDGLPPRSKLNTIPGEQPLSSTSNSSMMQEIATSEPSMGFKKNQSQSQLSHVQDSLEKTFIASEGTLLSDHTDNCPRLVDQHAQQSMEQAPQQPVDTQTNPPPSRIAVELVPADQHLSVKQQYQEQHATSIPDQEQVPSLGHQEHSASACQVFPGLEQGTTSAADQYKPSVPGQEVSSAPGQQVPSVPGQRVPSVPGQRVPSVPGQEIPSVPGQQLPSISNQQVSSIPKQQVSSVPSPQVSSLPGHQVSPAPVQQVSSNPGYQLPTNPTSAVSGQQVSSIRGQQVPSLQGQPVPSIPGQQVPSIPAENIPGQVPGQQVTSPPGHWMYSVPGQQVPSLQGQQVHSIPGQQVPLIPSQQVPSLQGQQVPSMPGQQVSSTPSQLVHSIPGQQVSSIPAQHVPSQVPGQQVTSPAGHQMYLVPGQQVPSLQGQQVPSMPGQQVSSVSSQQVPSIPGQQVPSIPGQQVHSIPGQQVPLIPSQQVPSLQGQQVLSMPGQQVSSIPSQQVSSIPAQHVPGQVPGQQVTSPAGHQMYSVPGQQIPSLQGQQVPSIQGHQVSSVPGNVSSRPGQQVPSILGQQVSSFQGNQLQVPPSIHSQVSSITVQQAPSISVQETFPVSSQQLHLLPDHQGPSFLDQQILSIRAEQVPSTPVRQTASVPGQQMSSVPCQQVLSIPVQHVPSVPAHQLLVPGQQVSSVSGHQLSSVRANLLPYFCNTQECSEVLPDNSIVRVNRKELPTEARATIVQNGGLRQVLPATTVLPGNSTNQLQLNAQHSQFSHQMVLDSQQPTPFNLDMHSTYQQVCSKQAVPHTIDAHVITSRKSIARSDTVEGRPNLSAAQATCGECEVQAAVSSCKECEMDFCSNCWKEIHVCGTLASHRHKPLEQPTQVAVCERCRSSVSTVSCEDCMLMLCAKCSSALHQKGARKRHRCATMQMAGPPYKQPAPKCARCSRLPAVVSCCKCSVICCAPCDSILHSEGEQALHDRAPLNISLTDSTGAPHISLPNAASLVQRNESAIEVSSMISLQAGVASPAPVTVRNVTRKQSISVSHQYPRNREQLLEDGVISGLVSSDRNRNNCSQTLATAWHNITELQSSPHSVSQEALEQCRAEPPALESLSLPLGSQLQHKPKPVQLPTKAKAISMCAVIPLLQLHDDRQDMDTLTQKVLVSENGICHLIAPYMEGVHASECTGINFIHLNQASVKTIGLYGNGNLIARYLLEQGCLDRQAIDALQQSPPGVYCISNGGPVQFLVFRPTENAFTELSRKNISCNMMRYLLELCNEVQTFFSGDEMDMFYQKPFTNECVDKRTQKMVMAFKKDSEEDVQFLSGISLNLPEQVELPDGVSANAGMQLTHSCHVRALHVGEKVQKTAYLLPQKTDRFSPRELSNFWQEKMRKFNISFSKSIKDENVVVVLQHASPEFHQMVIEMEQQLENIDKELNEEVNKCAAKGREDWEEHAAKLNKAILGLIWNSCPVTKFFFPDLYQQAAPMPGLDLVICPICHELLTEPKELSCQHAYCKLCLSEHAKKLGRVSDRRRVVFCPLCRREESLDLNNLPEAHRMLKQLLDRAKSAPDITALKEAEQKRQAEFQEAISYANSHLRLASQHKGWARKPDNINQLLEKQLQCLHRMERAYVVYSLALEKGWIPWPSHEDALLLQLTEFVGQAQYITDNGSSVDQFIREHCTQWRVTRFFNDQGKPIENEFKELERQYGETIVKNPLVAGIPKIFSNEDCRKKAKEVKKTMKHILKDYTVFDGHARSASQRSQQVALAEAKKKKLKEQVLKKIKEKMAKEYTSADGLSLEIQSMQVYQNGSSQYSYDKHRSGDLCQLTYREQCLSLINNVQQLYTFDLFKSDLEKLQEDSSAPIKGQPQLKREASCFPVNPDSQQLVCMYSLKAKKLLVFLKEKDRKGIDIYIQKPADYRKQNTPPRPLLQLKREDIDLIDFDEDSRMAAFHVPMKHRVDVHRFDADWKHWALRCQIDLQPHKGKAKLTHMMFMPGQEKLCLIDDGGHCHIFDIQDRMMRKRTILIKVPIKQAVVSLDGSCLLVFTTRSDSCPAVYNVDSAPMETSNYGCDGVSTDSEDAGGTDDCDNSLPVSGHQVCGDNVKLDVISSGVLLLSKEDWLFGGVTEDLAAGQAEATLEHDGSDIKTVNATSNGFETLAQEQNYHSFNDDGMGMNDREHCPGLNTAAHHVVVVHIYSLVNFNFIKAVDLDEDHFPPEVLPSLRLVMIGPQMHMVVINKKFNSLISRMVDVRSARNVFHMTDFDRSSKAAVHQLDKGKPVNYLDYLYHVYDKFCIEDCLGTSRRGLNLTCVLELSNLVIEQQLNGGQLCKQYVDALFQSLSESTHKPMSSFMQSVLVSSFATSCHTSVHSKQQSSADSCRISEWLQRLICLVPIQVCRAEQNQLTLFSNGLKRDPSLLEPNVFQLQENIEFGLYEAILDWWTGPVKVISSMGKQSTGKSYLLNHLTGSLFDISGDRCTDGVWMTMRVGHDCLYIVLDFEGLGSLERTEQEDMFLSVMNAAISGLTLFKTEFRVDQDTRNMLSRFRDGVELIKGDVHLLRGWFYINIKDVDKRDIRDLQTHFRTKLQDICKEDENNFLTKMYRGQLAIQTFPTLGNAEFYTEMDQIRRHLQSEQTPSFSSGHEFKDILKLLMAKIHMQEWSSFDRTMVALKVDRLRRGLPDAINQGHLINHNSEEEPLTLSSGEVVPDTSLELSDVQATFDLKDSGIILGHGKPDCELVKPLLDIFTNLRGSRDDTANVQGWCEEFQSMLTKISQRRCQRVKAWVEDHVDEFVGDGDVRILQSEVQNQLTRLSQDWSVCQTKCAQCFFPCLLLKYHDGEHYCIGSHKCQHLCEFCEEAKNNAEEEDIEGHSAVNHHQPDGSVDMDAEDASENNHNIAEMNVILESKGNNVLRCGDQAGHGGKHDCRVRNHTCGEMCDLFGKGNCNHYCAKKTGHDHDPADTQHRCNAIQHLCGESCSLPGCKNKCISPYELTHDRHTCQDTACPKKCCIVTCNNKCSEVNNHFHDIPGEDGFVVKHFCGMEHRCPEECESEGICEIVSERIIEKKLFQTSVGDVFEYQKVTEQNGSRKKCCIAIPPNQETHEGDHCCTLDENRYHFCDRRCPSCDYFCTLRFNHDETLHSTEHGNMRLTHVVSEKESFVVDTRCYGCGDSGEAEMCNFHCKSLGRGHIHIMKCEDKATSKARCTVSEVDGKRHETCKYGPDENIPKDELTHEAFWRTIRFRDPCAPEDQELFKLCPIECLADEHDRDDTKSYCTGPLWHEDYKHGDLDRLGGDGHIHSRGHHFKCVHSGTGPVHHVLIVDCSGSMSGTDCQPSLHTLRASHNNRLGAVIDACNQYLTMRAAKAQNDVVSFIPFESTAAVLFEGLALNPNDLLQKMMKVQVGGQTDFSPPLQRADEVIKSVERQGKRNCVVIFLSDGQGSFQECYLRSLLQNRVNRGEDMIRFHTIKFGSNHSLELKRMAHTARAFSAGDAFASQSSYSLSVDSIQLAEHFEQLASSLNKGGFLVEA